MKNRVIFVTLFLTWITPPVHALTVQKTCRIEASGEGCIFDLNATGAGTLQVCTKAGRVGDRWRGTAVQVNTTGASSAVGNGSTGTFTGCASRSVTNGISYEALGTWERPLPGTFPAKVTVQISGPFASVAGPRPLSFVEGGQGCPADGSVISCGALFKCRFDSSADIDVFKFAGSANGTVSINIAGPICSRWDLSGPTGNSIAGSCGIGEAKLPLTGNYTIQTRHTTGTISDYWLSLDGVSQAFQCGTPIVFGNVKNGNFDAPADQDTFQFVGQANQVVSINISGPICSRWDLFGPTGNLISGSCGIGEVTLSASGTHTIRVRHTSSLTGTYTLSLQKVRGP